MFRLFTTSRKVPLCISKILSTSFRTTAILRSSDNPADSTLNTSSKSPPPGSEDANQGTTDGYNDSIFDDAVADILRSAKLKARRKENKPPPEKTGADGLPIGKRPTEYDENGGIIKKRRVPRKKVLKLEDGLPIEKQLVEYDEDGGIIMKEKVPRKKVLKLGEDSLPIEKQPTEYKEESEIIKKKRKKRVPRKKVLKLGEDGLPVINTTYKRAQGKLGSDFYNKPGLSPRDDVRRYLTRVNTIGARVKGLSQKSGDRKRMNIVSEAACDVILDRLGPSLQKHIGCDIIDINPGAGVWSAKLHDMLKPRTHILLEPDTKQFGQLLEPLLSAPGSTYRLVPQSGLVWNHLEAVLSKEYLPHQTAWEREDPRLEERNDTLLIVANLGYYPRKNYRGFPSLAQMVMYQLIGAIKAQTLVQKYGRARMLIWMNDEERHHFVPKSINQRRKPAMEADLVCEEITEVASSTISSSARDREQSIDIRSLKATLRKMEDKGIKVPEGRESVALQTLKGAENTQQGSPVIEKTPATRKKTPRFAAERRFTHFTEEFEATFEILRSAWRLPDNDPSKIAKLAEYKERRRRWQEEADKTIKDSYQKPMLLNCESRITFNTPKSLLAWDRREMEPLRLDAKEFFPAKPMCLIDIQPKRLHPVLRKTNNYDILEYILTVFYVRWVQSVNEGLANLLPGAHEWLVKECPSLRDPLKGGNPDLDEMTVRCLTDEMFVEMVEAWARWPFRPSQFEILSIMGGATHDTGVGATYDQEDMYRSI
ncbi:uncharacterized protein RAG0_08782 [Rhynchosporium agropyri]|uniref:Mitochondrial transcription factor 1 n=1 Tax=Rhynchosporium agropyri TaxID=914238 RepID=A0A1E1KSB8_9HELO|nr:uncharacterized protein RAG0_08782 [Rhynchosporium agropyri]